MVRWRLAGVFFGGAVTLIKRIAIGVMAVAVTLAGCAIGARPFALEEQVGFDKATGCDITGVPPGLRFYGSADFRFYGLADYVYPGQWAYLPPP